MAHGKLVLALSTILGIAAACGSSDRAKHESPRYAGGADGGAAGDGPYPDGGADPGTAGPEESGGSGAPSGAGPVIAAGGAAGAGDVAVGGAGGSVNAPSCFGEPCSCVQQIHGSAVVRADGRLLIVDNGTQKPIRSAVTTQALDGVTSAWPGQYLGCAVRADGSVWCWANQADGNAQGLLGTGSGMPSVNPYEAFQVQIAPGKQPAPQYLSDVRAFHSGATGVGGGTLCAVTNAGTLFCWGPMLVNGDLAQTGSNEPYARQIKLDKDTFVTGAVELTVGYRHACYTNAKGEVYCWGKNIGGPLGNNSDTDSLYPVRAGTLSGVSKLTAGPDFTCALMGSGAETGRLYCWGASGFGVLGIGPPADNTDGCSTLCKKTPTRVRTGPSAYLDDVIDVAAGEQMSCALRSDHSVWCWGSVYGNYAVPLEAPAGVAFPEVGILGVHATEVRALLTDGRYVAVSLDRQRATVAVNCSGLD